MPSEAPRPRITIDDLGLFRGVERSALELARAGLPLNCSWVTNYHPPSDDYLKTAPADISSGLHFNVIEGVSELNSKSLTDRAGRFKRSWHEFLLPSAQMRRDVEAELEFQLVKARGWFGSVAHVDSHLHVHAIPWINRLVAARQSKFGYEYVRRPVQLLSDRPTLDARVLVLRLLSLRVRGGTGLPCFGVHQTFRMTADACAAVLPRGAREFVFHTHAGDEIIDAGRYRFFDARQLELRRREHEQLRELLSRLMPAKDATS